ncbi:MAG: cell division protein FtsA [Candidatus Omnitrophica bacterium]|nr:cell division protein FtsA [Candidatus Omnitrophota bacterium]MBU4346128.1 cell division protein FtsA [Candidatus Omnitrophota bacterium]MBU4473577.1 cell division protein FtsA [Candidatus Omnitrophota bacterium]MCG2706294.1 cell division protein FtsA [Candidatus Omnitrophota bacterium]
MFANYICALDIGSSKIASAVAQIKRGCIADIFFESLPVKGMQKGIIIDSIELSDCLARTLKNLKVKSGINIKSLNLNLSGGQIITKNSHAVIPLAERASRIITGSDIRKVNEQARILGLSLEEEIIHQIPFSYNIDSKSNILNPLGLYSHRLEVDLYLVCAKTASLQSLLRVVNQAGYEMKELFFSGIATSGVVFGKELKQGINILCDIGSDITELLVFKEGLLRDIEVLSIGGNDLTEGLSEALRIPLELAEDIKRSYAIVADSSQTKEDQEILIKKNNIYKPIKQSLVSEIITSKAKLIYETIKDRIQKKIPCDEVNNFVISGRSVLLEGFLEGLEDTLGVSVKIARITHPSMASLVNKNDALTSGRYLTYLIPLGIISQLLYNGQTQFPYARGPARNPFLNIINRVKEVYQEYF